MEEYGSKNKENTKELQDLDPKGSPHLEERWIVGNVDLDLLSLSPQKERIMGGMERKQNFLEVNNGGESLPRTIRGNGEKDPFIVGVQIRPLCTLLVLKRSSSATHGVLQGTSTIVPLERYYWLQ